ncbi:hypothetical protein GCM10010112_59290 [Actinoplanes lobatus]|uniref:Uncharacterized protein n=1 Tax=Actinoplanes lobatus TaxID=113568 RepID=A0A7W7HQB6_9ACTN|nr:hypothetical protein [Actinoplanes lobatus]MBB4754720.1 hypothetical protein [Actinoplanes lobatus]GGN82112.1 hypothetical protein GCM10010112_59290 [Actinoplanes lobatus]GIE43148.1 hypothetical protein Alo02nite_60460 [Actinoplanes lobatus]
MAGPSTALSPVIAASTHWLARAYPGGESNTVSHTLAELQARQAVTVAAWLRYPTEIDAALVAIAGPGGSAILDWKAGSEPDDEFADGEGWRTWVDEVVVSWAACLLADPLLARRGVDAVIAAVPAPDPRPRPAGRRAAGMPTEFRRLLQPDTRDREAAALLRHPDLLEPIATLHRDTLLYLLGAETESDGLAPLGRDRAL